MSVALNSITLRPETNGEETSRHFHVYRIVGDRAPDQCLFLAIETFWKSAALTIGVQAADLIHLDSYSITDTTIVLRVVSPVRISSEIVKVRQTFDESGFRHEVEGIRWRSAGRDSRNVRSRTLESIKASCLADKATNASSASARKACADDRIDRVTQRGAMQHSFPIPAGIDRESVTIAEIEALWKRLRDRKGQANAESVTLRCTRTVNDVVTICAVAPMHMSSEIAIAGGMVEFPSETYVVDGDVWHEPTTAMNEARALGIAGGRGRLGDRIKGAVHLNKDGSTRTGVDRFMSDGSGNTTIHLHGHQPFHFRRKGSLTTRDRSGVLIRLSVTRNEELKGREYTPIVAALKSKCGSAITRDPRSFSVVGTLDQPSSSSIVIYMPQSSASRVEKLRGIRCTPFSWDDLGKVSDGSAETIAISLGCGTGIPKHAHIGTSAIRTSGTGEEEPTVITILRAMDPMLPFILVFRMVVGLCTLMEYAWNAVANRAFIATDRMIRSGSMLEDRTQAAAAFLEQSRHKTVWILLRDVLHDDHDRIDAARRRCDDFDRVFERLGDMRSSETSSSVSGLVSRMASELSDVMAYANEAEMRSAARGVLETLERLAQRAEDERARLVQGLTDRLDTTRRFVDAKLDDHGLASIPDQGTAS